MRFSLRKDKLKRVVYKNNEVATKFTKIVQIDQSFHPNQRFKILNSKNTKQKSRAIHIGHTKNHCTLTARCGGVLAEFGLSRIKFREVANKGLLGGVRRASW